MIKELFKKIKHILFENKIFFISFVICFLIITIEFPYYIKKPGGIINVENRVEVENGFKSTGSLNMTYVSELKATIPSLIMSKFNKDWDIVSKKKENRNETEKEIEFRNKISLNEANNTSILVAYKKANKYVNIEKTKLFVIYVDKISKTNLKVGDEILSINNILVKSSEDVSDIINSFNAGEKIKVGVKNKNKEYYRSAEVIFYNDKKIVGVVISKKYDLDVSPNIKFNFKNSESGSSGGLMMTLAIYNSLIDYDITKGRTIAGTGTIDENGNVGEIDGIKYKLKGAVISKVGIFLVPSGNNYKEAIKIKKQKKYKIKIISIKNIDEAIEYLKK